MPEQGLKPLTEKPRRSLIKQALAASATLGAAGAGLAGIPVARRVVLPRPRVVFVSRHRPSARPCRIVLPVAA